MFHKGLKIFVGIVIVVLISSFLSHNYVTHFEKQRLTIAIPKHSKQTLFFYRDDCPDCQSIFHSVYWQSIVGKKVLFINMNQPKNRLYIEKYQLNSVPTFIHGQKRYSGTEITQIKRIIGD